MNNNNISDVRMAEIIMSGEPIAHWASRMDIPRKTLSDRIAKFKEANPQYRTNGESGYMIENPPNLELADGMTVREIIDAQKKQYSAIRDSSVPTKISVTDNLPIGILHFGDEHLDDPGCNLELLEQHMKLTHMDGVWGGSLGDHLNNWVGRLQRKYADQVVTESQGWKLAEWFIKGTNWLYIVRGNHDAWSGAGDPLNYLISGNIVDKSWSAHLELKFPNKEKFKITVKHAFPGRSQYNNAFGAMKQIFQGGTSDIYINGHYHSWGHTVMENHISGKLAHAIQVKGYKQYDEYATNLGYEPQQCGEACLTILDPYTTDASARIKVFWGELEQAVEYLGWLRNKYRKMR